jgi:glycine cleavage system aminomethyltransferase T
MHARHIRVGGFAVFAQRVTYVGELGWELYVGREVAGQVWDLLIGAGREAGIAPGGYRVLDSLRMEKGYRYYGADMGLLDTPFEAGLGFCVHADKWPELDRKPARRLRTLAVGDEDYIPIYGGEAVIR